jgi:hypothetical protein
MEKLNVKDLEQDTAEAFAELYSEQLELLNLVKLADKMAQEWTQNYHCCFSQKKRRGKHDDDCPLMGYLNVRKLLDAKEML